MGKWIKRPAKEPIPSSANKCGFSPGEQAVMDDLMSAYEKFITLPREHPDELRDFVDGIHKCQDQLGMRVLRRLLPDGWPTYEYKEDIDAYSGNAAPDGGPADA